MAFQLFQKNKQGDDRHLPSGNYTKFNSIMFSVIDHKHKKLTISSKIAGSWAAGEKLKAAFEACALLIWKRRDFCRFSDDDDDDDDDDDPYVQKLSFSFQYSIHQC